jgi:hypothetical protein
LIAVALSSSSRVVVLGVLVLFPVLFGLVADSCALAVAFGGMFLVCVVVGLLFVGWFQWFVGASVLVCCS